MSCINNYAIIIDCALQVSYPVERVNGQWLSIASAYVIHQFIIVTEIIIL